MTAAAFHATFSDWRLIKGRKVVQIVFEVPIELANQAYEVLGGMPNPAESVWCGIARLNQEVPARAPPSTPDKPVQTGERKTLTLASRAALLCKDPMFRRYVEIETKQPWPLESNVADWLRAQCRVRSRAEIKEGTQAAEYFKEIYDDFALWRDAPAMVE